jgi:hypothetical protein
MLMECSYAVTAGRRPSRTSIGCRHRSAVLFAFGAARRRCRRDCRGCRPVPDRRWIAQRRQMGGRLRNAVGGQQGARSTSLRRSRESGSASGAAWKCGRRRSGCVRPTAADDHRDAPHRRHRRPKDGELWPRPGRDPDAGPVRHRRRRWALPVDQVPPGRHAIEVRALDGKAAWLKSTCPAARPTWF